MKKYHIFLIILISLLTYANTLPSQFLYDDFDFVVGNPYIRSLSHLPRYFSDKHTLSPSGHEIYRPLRTSSYALDYAIFRLNPWGFHLVNIVVHTVNGILVYLLLNCLFQKPSVSFFSSLIFIVHPVQAETVAWVSSRADLLYSLFFLLAFLFFIHHKFILSGASFIFSLFSKETAMVFPLVLLLDGILRERAFLKKGWRIYLFFFVLSLAFFLVRFFVLGSFAQRPWWGGSFLHNLFTHLKVLPLYVQTLFFPLKLKLIYIVPVAETWRDTGVWQGIGVLVGLISLGAILYRFTRPAFFALSWLIITLLPVSGIFPLVGGHFCEHYLYLGLWGFGFMVSLWLAPKAGGRIVLSVLVCLLGLRTLVRNLDWRDEETLWTSSVAATPDSFKSHMGLGNAYLKKGKYEAAIKEYLLAGPLNPEQAEPFIGLGSVYFEQGRLTQAMEYFTQALKINPGLKEAYVGEGLIYQKMDRFGEAETAFRKALSLDPQDIRTYVVLGDLYLKQGDFRRAEEVYGQVLKLNPGSVALLFGAAYASVRLNQYAKAIYYCQTALYHEPHNPQVWNELGLAYGYAGRPEKAIPAFKKALVFKRDYAEVYNNLAVAYLSLVPPRLKEARENIHKAGALGFTVEEGLLEMAGGKGPPSNQ